MLDWPLRTLLVTALVAGPYLGVARLTGFDRALRFSLRRAGVGGRFVAGALALWIAGVVAIPQVGSTAGGFRLYVVGAVAFGVGLGVFGYAAVTLPTFRAVRACRPAAVAEARGSVAVRGVARTLDDVAVDDGGTVSPGGSRTDHGGTPGSRAATDGGRPVTPGGAAEGALATEGARSTSHPGGSIDAGTATATGPAGEAGTAAARTATTATTPPRRDGGTIATAPVSGRDCLVCETRTEDRIRRPQRSHEFWATTGAAVDAVPFALEDDTGWLRVDPEGARLEIEADGAGEDGPGRLEEGPRVRRVEHRVEPGDEVLVLGQARAREAPGGGTPRVIDGDGPAFVVADAGIDATASIRRAVAIGGPLGLLLLTGGLASMLSAVGVF